MSNGLRGSCCCGWLMLLHATCCLFAFAIQACVLCSPVASAQPLQATLPHGRGHAVLFRRALIVYLARTCFFPTLTAYPLTRSPATRPHRTRGTARPDLSWRWSYGVVATAAEDRLNFRRYSHTSFAAASDRRAVAIYESAFLELGYCSGWLGSRCMHIARSRSRSR
jgi:hypothetical protein